MPIEFRCTSCDKLLRVKDEAAGKQAKCPKCETVLQVPAAEAGAAPAPSPPPVSESENPYQSPESQIDPSSQSVLPEEARRKASAPANALIIAGIIGLVIHGISSLSLLVAGPNVMIELPGLQNNPFFQIVTAPWFGIATSIVGIARSLLIIFGGMQMKKLTNYPLVMAASIVAIVPCFSGCCLLDLPFGIWALVVISGASVRGAFDRAASAM